MYSTCVVELYPWICFSTTQFQYSQHRLTAKVPNGAVMKRKGKEDTHVNDCMPFFFSKIDTSILAGAHNSILQGLCGWCILYHIIYQPQLNVVQYSI